MCPLRQLFVVLLLFSFGTDVVQGIGKQNKEYDSLSEKEQTLMDDSI